MKIPTPSGAARTALVLAALLAVSGCATKGDLRSVSAELREVSARQDSILAELRYQSGLTQDTLSMTVRDLFQIRGDLVRRLTDIQEDIDRLTELTGENQRAMAQVRDQMVTQRRGGAQSGGIDLSGGGATGGTGTADDLYDAAVGLFDQGSLRTARTAFEDFLTQFPNDELAPRAQYYLAEIFVREDQPEEAIDAFLVIRERFPTDDKVPDALYRVGLLHAEQGDEDEARRYLELVINTYPDNPVTPLARDALRELGGAA